MIEIIYKEEQKKAEGNEQFFRIPNNIRQIGEIRGQQKIYIEDYAYTFLKKISRTPKEGGRAAILLGQYHWAEGSAYLFIKSALQVKDMEVSPEHIVFSDKVWGQVYEDSRSYFPQQEIVGWFVSLPGFNMQMNEVLLKTHLNHFAGNDKVLFVVEPGEWEEAFFVYENNQLNRQPGYYIYYEKNEPMQAYMIDMSQNKSIEETEKIPDRAVIDFRRTVKQRDERKEGRKDSKKELGKKSEAEEGAAPAEEKRSGYLTWTLGACTAVAALALGITFFNSYQNMSGTLERLVPGITSQKENEPAAAANAQTVLTPTLTAEQQSEESPLISREAMQQGSLTDEKSEGTSEADGQSGGGTAEGSQGMNETEESTDQPENEENLSGKGVQATEKDLETGQEDVSGTDAQESGTAQTTAQSAAQTTAQSSGAGTREYVIQKGDTLTSISKNRYGTIAKVEEICRLNGISPEDIIYAGQKILLPE